MKKIMIVEDTETIRKELSSFLIKSGYEVFAPTDFENIVNIILKDNSDLILLDINLPCTNGYSVCMEVRKKSSVPIIIVTGRNTDADEIMSMNIGADDFITKPYNTHVLEARIAALLRRSGKTGNENKMTYKNLMLNTINGTVECNGKKIEITKNEMKILACLIKNSGSIVSRDDLMDYMWSENVFVDDNSLSVNVTRLRKKLEQLGEGDIIKTRRGMGYILS